jgi:catechol 2,3-dioxygenase-like lactoylglutathione lyase family enzyme
MKKASYLILGLIVSFILGIVTMSFVSDINEKEKNKTEALKLGAFSLSLNVKNLKDSKQFYEYLGFNVLAGSFDQNYLILKNENALIGLFQGMFEGNILTFNPGWDERGQNIKKFDDIRIIEQQLKSKGVKIDLGIDSTSTGPASIMLTDPDGNIILFDQHR